MMKTKHNALQGANGRKSSCKTYVVLKKTMSKNKRVALVKSTAEVQANKLLALKSKIYNPDAAREAREGRPARPISAEKYRASITGHSLFKGLHRVTEEK